MRTIKNAKQLFNGYSFLSPSQVLVCLHDCSVGVADKGIKGYTATNYKIDTYNYNVAKEVVKQANNLIHPKLSNLEIIKIELSTF